MAAPWTLPGIPLAIELPVGSGDYFPLTFDTQRRLWLELRPDQGIAFRVTLDKEDGKPFAYLYASNGGNVLHAAALAKWKQNKNALPSKGPPGLGALGYRPRTWTTDLTPRAKGTVLEGPFARIDASKLAPPTVAQRTVPGPSVHYWGPRSIAAEQDLATYLATYAPILPVDTQTAAIIYTPGGLAAGGVSPTTEPPPPAPPGTAQSAAAGIPTWAWLAGAGVAALLLLSPGRASR